MTPTERKQAERERKRKEGLVLVQVWIKAQHLERLRKYVESLKRKA